MTGEAFLISILQAVGDVVVAGIASNPVAFASAAVAIVAAGATSFELLERRPVRALVAGILSAGGVGLLLAVI